MILICAGVSVCLGPTYIRQQRRACPVARRTQRWTTTGLGASGDSWGTQLGGGGSGVTRVGSCCSRLRATPFAIDHAPRAIQPALRCALIISKLARDLCLDVRHPCTCTVASKRPNNSEIARYLTLVRIVDNSNGRAVKARAV